VTELPLRKPPSWKISIRRSPTLKETWKCNDAAPCWNSITSASVLLTALSVAKLCRVADKWKSTEHRGNDTDRRKQKQSEKNMSQWNFALFQACAEMKFDLRCSGMSHSVDWQLFTDVSGKPGVPILKGQAVHKNSSGTSWRIKDQLDVTCYIFSLLMYSKCFGY